MGIEKVHKKIIFSYYCYKKLYVKKKNYKIKILIIIIVFTSAMRNGNKILLFP